jgi:putative exosortase-associated protein (TIGR04073 family)
MKRPLAAGLLLVTILCNPFHAYAAELAEEGTPARKLQRGFLNIALSPVEFSNEIVKLKKADTALPSWFVGIIKGSFNAVGRGVVGAFEILTFPVPVPSNYAPVVKPEFTWDYLKPLEEPAEG